MTLSLLERIEQRKSDSRDTQSDAQALRRSILSHLSALFNVRQGNALTHDDYGLPDFSDLFFQYNNPTNAICRLIEEVVQKYEPRLTDVKVEYDRSRHPDKNIRAANGELHLVMSAKVRTRPNQRPISLQLHPVLKGPGRLTVS